MTTEERISAFGYDPLARLEYIGRSSPIDYPGGRSKFEFYYNAATKQIDVCFEGCNGTYRSGREISDTETTLPSELNQAFFELKNRVPKGYSFFIKKWLGRVVAKNFADEWGRNSDYGWLKKTGHKIDVHFDVYYDPVSRSIDIYYVGLSSPKIRTVLNPDGSSNLPPEIHEAIEDLFKNPQSSVADHNSRCAECSK